MTFKEIAEFGRKEGFTIDSSKMHFMLTFRRKDIIFVEVSFPFDNREIKNGDAISWEYKLKDSEGGTEIYKDWRELYGENSLNDIHEDIFEFIEKISLSTD